MCMQAGRETTHPNTALWTSDLQRAAREYPLLSKHLCGVYAQDTLDRHLCRKVYPSLHIVNSDTAEQAGSHWFLVVLRRPGELYFYDSYGLSPRLYGKHLTNYVRRHGYRRYGQLSQMYQSYDTVVCGHYVLYFATRELLSHMLPSVHLSTHKRQRRSNDKKILTWSLHHFPSLYRRQYVKRGLRCMQCTPRLSKKMTCV